MKVVKLTDEEWKRAQEWDVELADFREREKKLRLEYHQKTVERATWFHELCKHYGLMADDALETGRSTKCADGYLVELP